MTFDVTTTVQSWLNGSLTNNGLMLTGTGGTINLNCAHCTASSGPLPVIQIW